MDTLPVSWKSSILFVLVVLFKTITCGLPSYVDSILDDAAFVADCEIIFLNVDALGYKASLAYSSGVFFTQLSEDKVSNKSSFHFEASTHRFTENRCTISFINVSNYLVNMPIILFNMLTPGWQPLTHKDSDYFVFFSDKHENLKDILMSEQFGLKILFKTGILFDPSQGQRLLHVNMYPENGAAPELVSIEHVSENSKAIDFFPSDLIHFNQKQFRVAIPKTPHYFQISKDANAVGGWQLKRGLYKKWLDVTQKKFNFTVYPFLSSAGGSTGKPLKNGTWVGSIGEVLSGNADMAAFNGHIANRHKLVHWSKPVTYECLIFIVHKSRPYFSPSSVYRPFPWILWLGLVVTVGVLLVTLFLMLNPPPECRYRLASYFYLSSLEQGAHHLLTSVCTSPQTRLIISFWLLFVLVMSTCYKGKLVGLIAFPKMSWVPLTFDELAYSDSYKVALNIFGRGGATYGVLSTSNSPVYQTFFQKMKIIPDSVDCLHQVLHADLGCLMVRSVAEFYEAKNFSDVSGHTAFQRSVQTALFREAGYVSQKANNINGFEL